MPALTFGTSPGLVNWTLTKYESVRLNFTSSDSVPRRCLRAPARYGNRLVALEELGFSLEQVAHIMADEVGAGELRGAGEPAPGFAPSRWAEDNGSTPSGPCRELYLEATSQDQHDWVTELRQPVAANQSQHHPE